MADPLNIMVFYVSGSVRGRPLQDVADPVNIVVVSFQDLSEADRFRMWRIQLIM